MKSLILVLLILVAALSFAQSQNDYTLALGFNYKDQARKNPTFDNKETLPVSFKYYVLADLAIKISTSPISKDPIVGSRHTGRGDTVLTTTYRVLNGTVYPVGVSFSYAIKFPTAIQGLGTGEFDHQVTAIIDRKFLQDRVAGEFDGGVYIAGQKGKASLTTPQFSFIETTGLGRLRGPKESYTWKWLHETDYSPAAGTNASSVTETNQIVYKPGKLAFLFGPTYAFTPYDSRVGFAVGIQYGGHFGKQLLPNSGL